jgi:hypothetical protein
MRWIEVLKKRQEEVGKVRDKLRADVEEMDMLKDSCERAHEDLQRAIEALSELA